MPRVTPVVKTTSVGTQGKARQRGQGPARGFWPTAVLLALTLLALTLFVTREAQGQETTSESFWSALSPESEGEPTENNSFRLSPLMATGAKRGAGYLTPPGSIAVWRCGPLRRIPIDTAAVPWNQDGSRKAGWVELMAQRYCGGSRSCEDLGQCPQGAYAEFAPWNREALVNACRAGALAPGHDCAPTPMEEADLALREPRCGSFYHRWRHQTRPGGTPENPILVNEQSYKSFYRNLMRLCGICELGLQGCDLPGSTCPWSSWYEVRHLEADPPWCQATPPPPPPDPPPPDPEPECTPYTGSACEAQCDRLTSRWPDAWGKERCLAAGADTGIGRLCAGVCPEDPVPPPPPEPDPPPVTTCMPGGWECSWEGGREFLKPGAPSTGALRIEIVCRECPEVEP